MPDPEPPTPATPLTEIETLRAQLERDKLLRELRPGAAQRVGSWLAGSNNLLTLFAAAAASFASIVGLLNRQALDALKKREAQQQESYTLAREFLPHFKDLGDAATPGVKLTSAALQIITMATTDETATASAALRRALPLKMALLVGNYAKIAGIEEVWQAGSKPKVRSNWWGWVYPRKDIDGQAASKSEAWSMAPHTRRWLDLAKRDDWETTRAPALRALCLLAKSAAEAGNRDAEVQGWVAEAIRLNRSIRTAATELAKAKPAAAEGGAEDAAEAERRRVSTRAYLSAQEGFAQLLAALQELRWREESATARQLAAVDDIEREIRGSADTELREQAAKAGDLQTRIAFARAEDARKDARPEQATPISVAATPEDSPTGSATGLESILLALENKEAGPREIAVAALTQRGNAAVKPLLKRLAEEQAKKAPDAALLRAGAPVLAGIRQLTFSGSEPEQIDQAKTVAALMREEDRDTRLDAIHTLKNLEVGTAVRAARVAVEEVIDDTLNGALPEAKSQRERHLYGAAMVCATWTTYLNAGIHGPKKPGWIEAEPGNPMRAVALEKSKGAPFEGRHRRPQLEEDYRSARRFHQQVQRRGDPAPLSPRVSFHT